MTISDVVPFGPGFVAVGTATSVADFVAGLVLVSADGLTWRWAPAPPDSIGAVSMDAAAAAGGHLVIVGASHGAFFDDKSLRRAWDGGALAQP